MTTIIDSGISAPYRFANQVNINIPANTGLKISEVGLFVASGTILNYVELSGTVGISAGDTTTISSIELRITRRLTSDPSSETVIYSMNHTLTPASGQLKEVNLGISHVDATVPQGYYAYALYIQRLTPVIEPASPAKITGPLNFHGTSYRKP